MTSVHLRCSNFKEKVNKKLNRSVRNFKTKAHKMAASKTNFVSCTMFWLDLPENKAISEFTEDCSVVICIIIVCFSREIDFEWASYFD